MDESAAAETQPSQQQQQPGTPPPPSSSPLPSPPSPTPPLQSLQQRKPATGSAHFLGELFRKKIFFEQTLVRLPPISISSTYPHPSHTHKSNHILPMIRQQKLWRQIIIVVGWVTLVRRRHITQHSGSDYFYCVCKCKNLKCLLIKKLSNLITTSIIIVMLMTLIVSCCFNVVVGPRMVVVFVVRRTPNWEQLSFWSLLLSFYVWKYFFRFSSECESFFFVFAWC